MLHFITAIPVQSVERVVKSSSHDKVHPATSTSPKAQELRTRYAEIQAAANANTAPELKKYK